jgi:hypothetical protein
MYKPERRIEKNKTPLRIYTERGGLSSLLSSFKT